MSDPCLYGCTIRDQHRDECTGWGASEQKCRGCAPRPAEYGLLCAWCWQRLQSDVATAPALVAHLREVGEPHAQVAPPSDTTAYRDPAERTILPDAWCAADEVHALISSYGHLVLEEHPHGQQMAGPDETGAVRSMTTAAEYQGDTYLRRSSVWGISDPDATARLVRWLLPLLPWCAEQEWAGEMRRELATITATNLARWPMQDTRSRAVRGVRCVRCGCESLDYTPTKGEGLPFHVACINPECGRVYTEAEYDAIVAQMTIDRGYVA